MTGLPWVSSRGLPPNPITNPVLNPALRHLTLVMKLAPAMLPLSLDNLVMLDLEVVLGAHPPAFPPV